jgi:glycerol 2-dehydrogenase (NADP+)
MCYFFEQRGTSVIPKSVTKSRIEANFQLDGWELTPEEMEALSNIKTRFKVCGDSWLPIKVFFNEEGDGGDSPSH